MIFPLFGGNGANLRSLFGGRRVHLSEFLVRQYARQGWIVCTDIVEMGAFVSGGWTGAPPDMLIVRGNRRIAVCIESAADLHGEYLSKKWKSILRNRDVSLRIIVRDDYSRRQVADIASRDGVSLECVMVKRSLQRNGRVGDDTFRQRNRVFALVAVLVLGFIAAALVLPSARKSSVPEYYSPSDKERQIESLRKELNKLQKK